MIVSVAYPGEAVAVPCAVAITTTITVPYTIAITDTVAVPATAFFEIQLGGGGRENGGRSCKQENEIKLHDYEDT